MPRNKLWEKGLIASLMVALLLVTVFQVGFSADAISIQNEKIEDEETINDLLSAPDRRDRIADIQSAINKPSIPIDLLGLNDDNASNLSSLSLKKIRKKALDRVEKEVITYVLEKTGWNRSKATKILNISYKTLLYKIKDLGIVPPSDSNE